MIAILMTTLNGERFLREQLDSIEAQTAKQWSLWVSDDGSIDNTKEILHAYQNRWANGKLFIVEGPGNGPTANFLSMVHNKAIVADYYAYCDQDDIWDTDKLKKASENLAKFGNLNCAVYCSRTRIIDEKGRQIGLSPLFKKIPSFANSLVQNIAGGNTMVLNNASRDLLDKVTNDLGVVGHDWWTYIMVAGAGGVIYYDPHPTISYRRHSANVMGSNIGTKALFLRIKMLLQGRYRSWIDANVRGINCNFFLLTDDARITFDKFCVLRTSFPLLRPYYMWRARISRQRFVSSVALAVFFILGLA